MNYLRVKTIKNLVLAGLFTLVGFCVKWSSIALTASKMAGTTQALMLTDFDWPFTVAATVQLLYQADIIWWEIVSYFFSAWAAIAVLVIIPLYRYFSVRLLILATVAFMLSTFVGVAPYRLAQYYVNSAAGNHAHILLTKSKEDTPNSGATETPATPERKENLDGIDQPFNFSFDTAVVTDAAAIFKLFLFLFVTISLVAYFFTSFRSSDNGSDIKGG